LIHRRTHEIREHLLEKRPGTRDAHLRDSVDGDDGRVLGAERVNEFREELEVDNVGKEHNPVVGRRADDHQDEMYINSTVAE
jgi:hypothetical protein